ncbi:MAG: CNNM domain-containing protein [Planctomycetota bacterium]
MIVTGILGAAGFVAGVLASALFSGLETGTYVLNKMRLDLRCAKGDRRAVHLRGALDRPPAMLGGLLIANNAANYWVTALAVLLLARAGVGHVEGLTTLVVTPTLFVLGEIVPKNLFRVAGEALTYRLGGVLVALTNLCRWTGLAAVLAAFSRAIIRLMPGRPEVAAAALEPRRRVHTLLAEGYAHGVLSGYQSQVAQRVVQLRSTRIGEVMVPRHQVVSVPRGCSRRRFLEVLRGHPYSRLVVWGDSPADVVGVVNVYDVLLDPDPDAAPSAHVAPPLRLAATLNVTEALLTLQRARRTMGIVVDDRDRFVGIVTLKDLVEEITGELEAW